MGLVIWYQDSHNIPIHMPISKQSFWLFFSTAIVFGYAIQWHKKYRLRPQFWIVLSMLLFLFIPLQWRILQYVPLRMFSLQILTIGELFFLNFVLEKAKPLFHRQTK
jgi:hypothetical protein